jgi:hypothetical protein
VVGAVALFGAMLGEGPDRNYPSDMSAERRTVVSQAGDLPAQDAVNSAM